MERGDESSNLSFAIERRPPPRRGKVAPFGERASRAAQPIDRPVAHTGALESDPARAAERPPHAVRWILQSVLKPRLERARIQTGSLRFGEHVERSEERRVGKEARGG